MNITYTKLSELKRAYEQAERATIAHNIRELLKSHNVKVYQLTDILGISKHNAYAYTKERGMPVKADLYNLLTLAAYFSVDPAYFFNTEQ